jgi:AcrR family transcriptional regulator
MMASPRDELLDRILGEVAQNGLGDRSLRDLADAVGTSHRMLLYHFESRHGLVAAIVESMEALQRDALTGLVAVAELGSPADTIRRTWTALTSDEVRPFLQLFYEAVAYSSRHGGAAFTTPWIVSAGEAATELGLDPDPVAARLGVAVTRGLLIDVITGDGPDEAAAALELYATLLEAHMESRTKKRTRRATT